MKTNGGFKIGEIAFYEDKCWLEGTMKKAKITGFDTTDIKGVATTYAKTSGISFVGDEGALLTDLYRTEKECADAITIRHDAKKQAYRDRINDEKDLVKFMYGHCINGDEYTDWDAKEVVVEKATEFGIDLNS